MAIIRYVCPATGDRVQTWLEEPGNTPAFGYYKAVECPACVMIHFVVPETGKIMEEKKGRGLPS